MITIETLKELSSTLLKISPIIATAIGSPIGGMVATLLAQVFGVPLDHLNATIGLDNDSITKIKQFENEHIEELAKIAYQGYQTEVDDRISARERDIKETELLGRRDWVMDAIAITVVVGFFAMTFVISLTKMDSSDHDVLFMLIGQLSAGFLGILSFFFGSIRKP